MDGLRSNGSHLARTMYSQWAPGSDRMRLRGTRMRSCGVGWTCIAALALLAGCGGGKPMPSMQEAQLPAEARVGDVTVRATTMPTLRLNAAMAQQYGVAPDARSVLVVVGLRRGDAASETSLPGRIRARATDLLGSSQAIELREMRADGFIDYVGTASVSMPDTLRYEIDAQPQGGPALSLRFNRDYFAEGAAGSQ